MRAESHEAMTAFQAQVERLEEMRLFKNWCQKKKTTVSFQPCVLVTSKLFLASLELQALMKLVQVYYPPEAELLQILFYSWFYLFCVVMTTVFFPFTSIKSWLHQAGLTQEWFTFDEAAAATHSLSTAVSTDCCCWSIVLFCFLFRHLWIE